MSFVFVGGLPGLFVLFGGFFCWRRLYARSTMSRMVSR